MEMDLQKKYPNLLVAGEAAGGIHGRNRLMGKLSSGRNRIRKKCR